MGEKKLNWLKVASIFLLGVSYFFILSFLRNLFRASSVFSIDISGATPGKLFLAMWAFIFILMFISSWAINKDRFKGGFKEYLINVFLKFVRYVFFLFSLALSYFVGLLIFGNVDIIDENYYIIVMIIMGFFLFSLIPQDFNFCKVDNKKEELKKKK